MGHCFWELLGFGFFKVFLVENDSTRFSNLFQSWLSKEGFFIPLRAELSFSETCADGRAVYKAVVTYEIPFTGC